MYKFVKIGIDKISNFFCVAIFVTIVFLLFLDAEACSKTVQTVNKVKIKLAESGISFRISLDCKLPTTNPVMPQGIFEKTKIICFKKPRTVNNR